MNLETPVASYNILVGFSKYSRIICSTTVDSNKAWKQLFDDRNTNTKIQSICIVCEYTDNI